MTVVVYLLEHRLPKPRVSGWYVLQVHNRQTPPHKFIEFPLFLAGIGKKCHRFVAFSVKTCRYRQENAISGLNIDEATLPPLSHYVTAPPRAGEQFKSVALLAMTAPLVL